MKLNFSFNSAEYDFWPIYNAIKEFYPIGIDNRYPGIFFEYPGLKKLESILVSRIHDNNNFRNEWKNYWESVSQEMEKPIIGTTYGQAPSFSSYVILNEEKGDICDYFEELHFSVSLIGPFYTIIGQSRTVVNERSAKKAYQKVNRITSSPTKDTQKYFDLLTNKIESKYQGYQFVPYFINDQFLEGLRVRYRDDSENRIYNALFNDLIQFDAINSGDPYYGIQSWKR